MLLCLSDVFHSFLWLNNMLLCDIPHFVYPFTSAWVRSPFSGVRLFATLWTIVHYVPLSLGFSRQEYWNGLPSSPPGDLPDPGIETAYLTSLTSAGRFFTTSATWEAPFSSRRTFRLFLFFGYY